MDTDTKRNLDEQNPVQGVPLHRPGSLLDWHRTGDKCYVGGDYAITLVGRRKWETDYLGDHLEFNDSREWSFRSAEEHHREVLRRHDLMLFGTVAMISGLGLFAMWAVPPRGAIWVLGLVVLWILFASALTEFLHTLARFGRLRTGARFATPFGRTTHMALDGQRERQ